ncbi:MAG: AAA family ATPase [Lamprobacter sp.]|uniref:ExeA family protein n=1 Tax=Lamprobacter sp. TaxID=3100796 RepID=UPI002B25A4FF|nr:AAA family ATPase [Lamprobacter sp.]MEA3641361.1 AAA family ATPase [Lamprobacter sp.]
MFEVFYGLKEDPFRLSADHRFCYPHRNFARARAYVDYALHRAEGFVMVTGRPGTGKTTLINDLLSRLPEPSTRAATLLSTRLDAEDLLRMTAYALGLETRTQPKALLLQQLMEFMNEQYRRGGRTLLIIDEAQDLGASALEELRLLTNLHQAGQPLLQIVLVGQEPLRELVRRPEMEQLHQRLIAAWHLQPLSPAETVAYVRHRLETAGWQGDPVFEPGVLQAVYHFSQGVPRRINLICSRLLLHGCLSELHRLSKQDALDLVHELGEEELAPEQEGTTELPEVDWAEVDQGLDWVPPMPAVADEAAISALHEPVAAAASPDTLPQAEQQVSQAVTESAAVPRAESIPPALRMPVALEQAAAVSEQAAAAPEQVAAAPAHLSESSPVPWLAVEHSGALLASTETAARADTSAPSCRIEPPRKRSVVLRRIKRRSAGILGLILMILLSLLPAGMLMVPMVLVLPASMPLVQHGPLG